MVTVYVYLPEGDARQIPGTYVPAVFTYFKYLILRYLPTRSYTGIPFDTARYLVLKVRNCGIEKLLRCPRSRF